MKVDINQIKKLRTETHAPVIDVKKALEETEGNVEAAKKILMKKGFEKAAKKAQRATKAGRVFVYQHHSGTVSAMLELYSETDFVARNEVFENLGREIVMQIASMNPKNEKVLVNQDYIRDPGKKVGDLVKEAIAKTGENIKLGRFVRMELGENS